MMSRRLRWVLGLGAVFLAAAAGAYVLPGAAILRRAAETRDELHLAGLRVEGTAMFLGAASSQVAQALGVSDRKELLSDAVLLMKTPGRCRLELGSSEGTNRLTLVQSPKKHPDASAPLPAAVALREICALLATHSSGELGRHLSSVGVETGRTQVGRVDRQKLAYLLGSSGEGQSQAAFFKASFLPAQVRLGKGDWAGWEVHFLDYGSAATGDWFPRVVEVFRGSELLLRLTALRAEPRANLADSAF
jgi:hypothetical protein